MIELEENKHKIILLKEKLKTIRDEENIRLLASDCMLIKRPLLITDNLILVGFKQSEWEKIEK